MAACDHEHINWSPTVNCHQEVVGLTFRPYVRAVPSALLPALFPAEHAEDAGTMLIVSTPVLASLFALLLQACCGSMAHLPEADVQA